MLFFSFKKHIIDEVLLHICEHNLLKTYGSHYVLHMNKKNIPTHCPV